jgi:NADPH:quinone reductase-like Zn-dependent oxidoreductase
LFSRKRCGFVVVKPVSADLEQLAAWFEQGKLSPVLDSSFPLAELPRALQRQRSGDVRGKLAITIAGTP